MIINYFIAFLVTLCMFKLCSAQIRMRPVYIEESALTPRVVAGTPAVLGELPYQVGFKKRKRMGRNSYATFCGGSIIGEAKLLSAAHCFGKAGSSCYESTVIQGAKLANMYAVAGFLFNEGRFMKNGKDNGQWRRLKVVMYPSHYKFPFHADIAIVMLHSPFVFNSHVNMIPYAKEFKDYRGSCLASGYGRTNPKTISPSPVLLKANLELLTNYWCGVKFRRNMKKLICTSQAVTDVGKGDSGGPLVCSGTRHKDEGPRGILVGVVSGSRLGKATFFTRVSTFSKYIAKNQSDRNCVHGFFWGIVLYFSFTVFAL